MNKSEKVIEPKMKKVSKQEYIDFINNYPRKLERDVTGISDPPLVSYNDFKLADKFPNSVVAHTHLWSDNPKDYFYCPEKERDYYIMENYEDVFKNRQ